MKMTPLCELQAKQHGVQLGTGYKNNQACSVFIKYIVKEQHIYFDPYADNGKVHIRSKIFAVRQPKDGTDLACMNLL